MRKVGVRDENYPLTFLCPLGEVLRLDSGLAQANFGPVPGGRLPAGGRYAARTGGCGTARALEIRRVF